MKNEEYKIQTAVIQWLDLKYPKTPRNVSPAAGFKVSMGLAMKMMRMGYQKGTEDLTILEPSGSYHGLCIEFKTVRGKVSPEQHQRLTLMAQKGYRTAICRSLLEAQVVIDVHMSNPF